MTMYKGIIIPDNYKEICDSGSKIGTTIKDGGVPEPGNIAKVFGYEAVDAYILMHALFHSIQHPETPQHPEKASIFRSARRDGKAVQIHSYDMALKSYYRLMDPVLPSGYLLTLREVIGDFIHDLGEGFGKSLLGALVVNDVIKALLGEEAAHDAEFLTDKNGLLLDTIETRVGSLPIINHNSIYKILTDDYKKNELVNSEAIKGEYDKVKGALSSFRTHVEQKVGDKDMAKEQKDALITIINRMYGNVEIKLKNGEILEPQFATSYIKSRFEHVLEIIGEKRYIPADPELVPPLHQEYLITLDKTLYRDYINEIVEEIKREAISAYKNGKPDNDNYLALGMEKLTDATDNALKMQPEPFRNATDIFRNSRNVIVGMTGLIVYFKEHNIAHERLQRGLDYLIRNLGAAVNENLLTLRRRGRRLADDYWERELNGFQYMLKKAKALERKIVPIVQDTSGKGDLVTRIGSAIHII